MSMTKCKECKHSVSSKAESCPHCGNLIKKSYHGYLIAVILCFIVVVIMVVSMENSASLANHPDLRKPSIELSMLTGTFVSSTDPQWKVQIANAPSSGGAYGGWNGAIRLYGPHPDFDGSPFRCRVFGNVLTVELMSNTEATIVKMFSITDDNTLTCTLSDYWPGTLRKQ